MSTPSADTILKVIKVATGLATEIVGIILEKGDAAGNLRLKDLRDWDKVVKRVDLYRRATDKFRQKVRAARGG